MASYTKSMLFFLSLLVLVSLISLVHSTGFTVDLIHRDSPHSPSYDPSKTRFQHLRSAFDRSFARKSSLARISGISTQSIETTITPNGGEYLLKYAIGTPPVEQLGIADTGSDLTWTQCKPCTQCYKQTPPLFDPSRTKSYAPVSCEAEQCTASGSNPSCGTANNCQYQVSYGDRSFSIGDLAAETFTFGANATFSKVLFGCGHQNDGTFGQAGAGSGIVGLGGGSVSIINQLESSVRGRFSYCLTLLDSNASSKISFGSNAIVTGPFVVSTPLVKKSPDTFYYLTLEGVSVGSTRVDYRSKNVKAVAEDGNIIIDSGTTLTFVPAEFYEGLESALVKAISGTRTSDSGGTFRLCYESPSGGLTAPPIIAHFRGADVALPPQTTFVQVEQGVVCLTILPSEDVAIFGNLNQMNFNIGYDLVGQKVDFLGTDCTKVV